jgi:hypothetical protein
MSQRELDCAVALATGESLGTVRRRGFSVINLQECEFDDEPYDLPAQVIDWDAVDAQRRAA